jgi:hypothetical protein
VWLIESPACPPPITNVSACSCVPLLLDRRALRGGKNAYGIYVGNGGYLVTDAGLIMLENSEPAGAFSAVRPVWCAKAL